MYNTCWNSFNSPLTSPIHYNLSMTRELLLYSLHTGLLLFLGHWKIGNAERYALRLEVITVWQRPG